MLVGFAGRDIFERTGMSALREIFARQDDSCGPRPVPGRSSSARIRTSGLQPTSLDMRTRCAPGRRAVRLSVAPFGAIALKSTAVFSLTSRKQKPAWVAKRVDSKKSAAYLQAEEERRRPKRRPTKPKPNSTKATLIGSGTALTWKLSRSPTPPPCAPVIVTRR